MPFVVVKVKIWGRFGVLIGLLEGNLRSGEDTEKREKWENKDCWISEDEEKE